MSATDHPTAPVAEPTPAELVRSVLAAARSLTLTTEAHRVDLVGLHSLEAPGRLLLNVPAGSHVGAEVARAPGGDLAASLEFIDVAPVSVPDRIRARVLLGGWLSVDGQRANAEALCFETVTAELGHDGRRFELEVDELTAAEPDPLAATEAELLTHLAGAHGDAVELLAQLVDHRSLLGVTRVDPLRVDRYGIVLRLSRASGYHDVRLPFPVPLRNPAHGVLQMRALLTRAKACPRRSRR
ncbi:DUF2470 domain-containing protein [Actinoallomurus iriomotensis]|uniref:DUF2470 domain-containing protein n=1 Tax=Actinoallomurus iriomotensis TaxID=478107 RepID=A0A9W6RPL6_9ACTN|nr:DUF2470 domain-containing protein [Actinoallomurus iriomotensis]GLY77635.1 hypothetical protein Airi01_059020 [Actinoallomurus iriomotensis]